MPTRRPISMRSAVKAVLRATRVDDVELWEPVALEMLRRKWEKVVGEIAFARNTAPSQLAGGVLTVVAATPQWAEQVQLHAKEILRRSGRALMSASTVQRLLVGVGRLPAPPPPPEQKPEPPVAKPDPVWLAILRREATSAIADPELRERVVSWLARQATLEDLKESAG